MEIIKPENETHWKQLRSLDVTSTECAALFNLSPYSTHLELWHRKKDKIVVNIEENERMKWGKRLEKTIAEGFAEDNQLEIAPMKEYIREPVLRMGSSFDFKILSDEPGILEIKNVDSLVLKNDWIEEEDGTWTAPNHIELQVQHQLALTGWSYAYIGVLVGGNRPVFIKRDADPIIGEKIKNKIREFWISIENNTPPPINFERDAEFINKLYGYAEPNKVIDGVGNERLTHIAATYKNLGEQIKTLTSMRDACKAEILTMIQDAEKCLGNGFTISCGLVGPAHVEYDREGYRSFRISFKKVKGE